ncbi:hypothetical protein [Croceicoccus sp. YJ47]|uniref:hypothetical protein n=1 Tax=Croceicoccus sp. YJ47 TaxID=2798724 RepID=UPI0019236126|nr:hypothetical protein [Croceicoccus sp. YJ47]QQN74433.1 hypothetical protein JD971_01160 [Croceicoccus sp. YJ47]
MPIWIELLVSLLIVYAGIVALTVPWLRRRRRLRALQLRREASPARKREEQ